MDNKIWEENTLFSANDIHLLTMIVEFEGKYYYPEDKIPYPTKEPKIINDFQATIIQEEDLYCDKYYDEVYNKIDESSVGCLWTNVITKFSANSDMEEIGIVAQYFIADFPIFLEKLQKDNFSVYHNEEYSPFKWLCWIKDDTVRLIHQNYRDFKVKTEFDILIDKEIFLNACNITIKQMQEFAKKDLKKFQEYAIKKYGKIDKNSIPYPLNKSNNIGNFKIKLDVNYNEDIFEDFYKTKEEPYTTIYANLDLKYKKEEVILIAEYFNKYFPEFIEELKQIENSTYSDMEYTETKLYGWIKGDKIRLIYQDFSSDEHEIIFDITVDKNWFFEFSDNLIKDVQLLSKGD